MPVRRLLLGLALALAAAMQAEAGSVEIITNGGESTANLDRGTIRAIFSMRLRQWPDGTAVRVFVLPDNSPLHASFSRELLGTYPYLLRATWDRLVYTGTGIAPEVVDSEREMRERVTKTPGAIGYVSKVAGPDSANDRILSAWLAEGGGL